MALGDVLTQSALALRSEFVARGGDLARLQCSIIVP